jgi:hypothetical protein
MMRRIPQLVGLGPGASETAQDLLDSSIVLKSRPTAAQCASALPASARHRRLVDGEVPAIGVLRHQAQYHRRRRW